MRHDLKLFSVSAGLVLVVAGLAWESRTPVATSGSAVVARIDGQPVRADEVDARFAELLPMASFHGNVDDATKAAIRRTALDELLFEELIYREARRTGRVASRSDIDAEVAGARARFADEAEYERALAEIGLDEQTYRARLLRLVTVARARARQAAVTVGERDVQAYYDANRGKFVRQESAHVLEILARADPSDPRSAADAGRRARALAARIRGGEPFPDVARAESDDEYRVKDGDLGWVHRGRLDPDLERAVFGAPAGAVRVAQSIYGFHVFSVLALRPETTLTLDEARPIILDRLTRQRREARMREWRRALLAQARIEILDPALREARAMELPALDGAFIRRWGTRAPETEVRP